MISHRPIMEHVGFTNTSDNFHDCPNYGSGSWGSPKIMEIVRFTNILREPIMKNVGFTNISSNFHDCPNYGSGSWGFSEIMEIVGKMLVLPTFSVSQSWKLLVLPTISMIFQTSTLAHEVSRNSWELLELLVLPTFSVRQSWKLSVFAAISMIFQTSTLAHEVSRNSRELLELLVLPTFSVTQSWKLLVFTNTNYGSGSRSFSIFMESVGIVGFTNIFRVPITELLVLPTISMIFQTMALAHDVSRKSRKLSELLV